MRISSSRFVAPLLLLASLAGSASVAFAAIPFPMASGNYSESFSDIANWTNNFASGNGAQYWASVPLTATGTIPDGVRTSNTTASFVSGTTEGVQKGSGNIQLLATNATDNSHAVAIDVLLDYSGVDAGTLSFDFASVANSTGNRNGSMRVYTSIDGVNFTELPAAAVLNFQNNVAFSTQITNVALPASFSNCPTARIRFYDYNATGPGGSSGARPKASIDNLLVTSTPTGGGGPTGPVISNISTLPAAPADTQGVHVQASVVDVDRPIGAVSLAWGLSNASLPNIIAMTPTTGDFWQTTVKIPPQSGGTTVYYQITAEDDSATSQSSIRNYTVIGTGGGGTAAPEITSVFQASDSTLQVFFDVPVDPASSQNAGNYNVNGIVAVDAVQDADTTVTITVRNIPPGDRILTANGVGDGNGHFTSNETFGFRFIDVSIPAGYYNGTAGLKGYALVVALHNIIKGHTAISYTSTATAFQRTDKRPNGHVWDVYSDIPGGTPPYEFVFGPLGSSGSEGGAYNREHSFPQSWFGNGNMPMYSDLWNVYPTDSKVNNERGNDPYAKVGTASWTSLNGSKSGTSVSPGYSGACFEPIDGYKGDLMRSQFYMTVRYFNEDASWPGSASVTRSQLNKWAADQYLQWSLGDPVSWKERLRNGAIYEYQHNRNPFVDHPEFASAIWDSNSTTTGVGDGDGPQQGTIAMLRAASPNPFQARTTIVYDLPRSTRVSLAIYDASGRMVRSLVAGAVQEAGRHTFEWDGRDHTGAAAPTGLYFSRLEADGRSDVKRVVRIR